MTKAISTILGGALFLTAAATAAQAGGLERGGYNWDLLFDAQRFATEAGVVYVMPHRKFKNAVDIKPADGIGSDGLGGGKTSGDLTEPYAVPRFGVKVGLTPDVDCLASYSQPWGADSKPGADWIGAQNEIQTQIRSNDYGLTCSYKFHAGKGTLRTLGGISYQEIEGFKERLLSAAAQASGLSGNGRTSLAGHGIGWRAGAAYEIPEMALRASLIYNAPVDIDLDGKLDTSGVGLGITDIYGKIAMPQSVELKLQSGIAPGWLAFGSVKWVDWSTLDVVTICPSALKGQACSPTQNRATSLDLMYQDGWTVMGGIGHKFNDKWSGAVQV
ncbi:MAG: OmpP1/FadL family transporter, partial [Phyllobacterium sp.]